MAEGRAAGREMLLLDQNLGVPDAAGEGTLLPLAVDLDGTLVATDLLLESCLLLLKQKPLYLLRVPFWLLRGRAYFKRRLARQVIPDAATLPYRGDVLRYLKGEKERGRKLLLVTGADHAVAQAVASRLGLFDEVIASDGVTNLRGAAKESRLIESFGRGRFDYAGNSASDVGICEAARKTILVAPAAPLRRAAVHLDVERAFNVERPHLGVYLHALRLHHWLKNALVFVPMFVASQTRGGALLVHAALAFASLCLCASSVYLLNDLLDLPEDRRHPHKKQRMLASGRLPVTHALALIPLLLAGAVLLGLAQPPLFLAAIGIYLLLMLGYCLRLRDIKVMDTLILAAGYTLRIVAGAIAVALPIASSLLVMCFLFFFGLALLKRYAELGIMRRLVGTAGQARGYAAIHSGRVAFAGCLTSYLALALFAVKVDQVQGFAGTVTLLPIWSFCTLLLVWLSYMWVMAGCGRIRSDPMSFAVADFTSRAVILLMGAALLLAFWR